MSEWISLRPPQLPPVLEEMLLGCQAFENTATGSSRRGAFRITRALIGALLADGYSVHTIAELLGVTSGSVRSRGATITTVPAAALTAVPGLANAQLDSWLETNTPPGADGTIDLRKFVASVHPAGKRSHVR